MPSVHHILGVGIMNAQVLSEAKRLRIKPGLLELYQDKMLLTVLLTDSSAKINTEHRQGVPGLITILMGADFHGHNIFLQQCGKNGTRNTLVLHQVLKHYVIYRIGYYHIVSSFGVKNKFRANIITFSQSTATFMPKIALFVSFWDI